MRCSRLDASGGDGRPVGARAVRAVTSMRPRRCPRRRRGAALSPRLARWGRPWDRQDSPQWSLASSIGAHSPCSSMGPAEIAPAAGPGKPASMSCDLIASASVAPGVGGFSNAPRACERRPWVAPDRHLCPQGVGPIPGRVRQAGSCRSSPPVLPLSAEIETSQAYDHCRPTCKKEHVLRQRVPRNACRHLGEMLPRPHVLEWTVGHCLRDGWPISAELGSASFAQKWTGLGGDVAS